MGMCGGNRLPDPARSASVTGGADVFPEVPIRGFMMLRSTKRIAATAALAAPLAMGLAGVASTGMASASTTASASTSHEGGQWYGHHHCDPCDPCGGGDWDGGHYHHGGDDGDGSNGDNVGIIIG